MNNLKYISLFIILLFTGIACTNLDEVWYSAVTPETFLKQKKMLMLLFTGLSLMHVGTWKMTVGGCRNILLINLLLQQKALTGTMEVRIIDIIIINGQLTMVGYGRLGEEHSWG